MTREEQKKYKEMTRYLAEKAKEEAKKYHLKKKDYMFYLPKGDMFYYTMLDLRQKKLTAYFYAKPLWLDDILWDILDMSSNKEEPVSLRSVGAFTIHSMIREKEFTAESTEEIDKAVGETFEELTALADSYGEEDFLAECHSLVYQHEVIEVIVLLHQGEYEKALALCQEKEIGYFGVGNKDFSQLAVKYIRRSQRQGSKKSNLMGKIQFKNPFAVKPKQDRISRPKE